MRLYVASSLTNLDRAAKIMQSFRDLGVIITHDWTQHGKMTAPQRMAEISHKELSGVITADCVLMVWPAGRGSHFEFGAAVASRIPVVVLAEGDHEFTAFHHLPAGVEHSSDLATAQAAVMKHLGARFPGAPPTETKP